MEGVGGQPTGGIDRRQQFLGGSERSPMLGINADPRAQSRTRATAPKPTTPGTTVGGYATTTPEIIPQVRDKIIEVESRLNVFNSGDPNGGSFKGIRSMTLGDYMKSKFVQSNKSVAAADAVLINKQIRKTGGTPSQALHEMYKNNKAVANRITQNVYDWYIKQSGAENLPYYLVLPFTDYAVNSGKTYAIKALQKALEITADGVWGDKTMDALMRKIEEMATDEQREEFVGKIFADRYAHIKKMADAKGLKRRVQEVEKESMSILGKNDPNKISVLGMPVAKMPTNDRRQEFMSLSGG